MQWNENVTHSWRNIWKKAEGTRIRSKCLFYEEGEKSLKFFLNLKNCRGIQGQIWKLIVNNQEIFLLNVLANFSEDCESFLNKVFVPKLKDAKIGEGDLNELELLKTLKSMQNNKSPGNGGLTKEFYEMFWNEIKHLFMNSIMEAREKKKLSISQRQTTVKLIGKKERGKRFVKNWHPISLLNLTIKLLLKH